MLNSYFLALVAGSYCFSATSAVPMRLATIFGDNMVLQRDVETPVWGWTSPSEAVFASLYSTTTNTSISQTTTSDSVTGLFTFFFPAMPATYPMQAYTLTVSTDPIDDRCNLYAFSCDGGSVQLLNLVFGDVLFGVGQSNMQVNVGFAFNSSYELNWSDSYYAAYMRIFQVQANAQSKTYPLDDFASAPQIPWSLATNVTLPTFSATAWFTAKSIIESRPSEYSHIPLGIVASTWGGTPIKTYCDQAVNQQCSALYPYPNGAPAGDCGLFHAPCNASALYNSMYAPLFVGPMKVSAIIFFQGENDTGEEAAGDTGFKFYSCMLQGLANTIRTNTASPFAHWSTVQLAPYSGGSPSLPNFRKMQCDSTVFSIPNSSCVVIIDGGDPLSPIGNVHSRNKQLVGRRVAAGIVKAIYNVTETSPASLQQTYGPRFASATYSASADGSMLYANISFDPASVGAGGLLVYVPPHVDPWQNASRCATELPAITLANCDWFNIQGSNTQMYNATNISITLMSNGVQGLFLTSPVSPPVPGITAVGSRYGWNEFPVVNYYNAYGFPVESWNTNMSSV